MIKPPLQRESATLVCNGGRRERGGRPTKFLTDQEGVRAELLIACSAGVFFGRANVFITKMAVTTVRT